MYGTSVEHHALYQYQFAGTKEIFAGQVQTETAYYQPKPDARDSVVAAEGAEWGDPIFEKGQSGWGLRVVDSQDISIYGAGLYSFFDDYDNCEYPSPSTRGCGKLIVDSMLPASQQRLPNQRFQH